MPSPLASIVVNIPGQIGHSRSRWQYRYVWVKEHMLLLASKLCNIRGYFYLPAARSPYVHALASKAQNASRWML